MSLLKQALDLLGDQVDDKTSSWFDKLIDQLDDLIKDVKDQELKAGGEQALDTLRDHKDKFLSLGRKSFILFITYAAAERGDEAAKEYYRTKASAREIINSILDDAFDVEKARLQKEEILAEALTIVGLIGKGAKFLVPFLLTII